MNKILITIALIGSLSGIVFAQPWMRGQINYVSNIPRCISPGVFGCFYSNSQQGEACACTTNGAHQLWTINPIAADTEYNQDTASMIGNGTEGNAQQGSVDNPIVTP